MGKQSREQMTYFHSSRGNKEQGLREPKEEEELDKGDSYYYKEQEKLNRGGSYLKEQEQEELNRGDSYQVKVQDKEKEQEKSGLWSRIRRQL